MAIKCLCLTHHYTRWYLRVVVENLKYPLYIVSDGDKMNGTRKGKERIDAYIPVDLKNAIEEVAGKGNMTNFIIQACENLLFSETSDPQSKKMLLLAKRGELERRLSNLRVQKLGIDSEKERLRTLEEKVLAEMSLVEADIKAIDESIADLDNPDSPIRKELDTPNEIPDFILGPLTEKLDQKRDWGFKEQFRDAEHFIRVYETWLQHNIKDAEEKGYKVKKKDLYKYIREYYKKNS